MSKWTDWYNNLPPNTKAYLANQKQLWTDCDVARIAIGSLIIGFVIGLAF